MKKKIVIACLGYDLSGGGAEHVALQLLNLLDRSLFSIELCYLRNCGELHQMVPSDLEPIYFSKGNSRFRSTILPAFSGYRTIARRADLLFGMMEGIPIYLASLIGSLEGKPSIGWNHTTTSQSFVDLNRVHQVLMPLLYPHVSQMICVSQGARTDLMRLCRFKNNAPVTIHNPLDREYVRSRSADPLPEYAHRWYSRPVVISVGRLVEEKKTERLIQAFAVTVRNGLDANLVLLGKGPLRDRLERLSEELGVGSRVFFAGFQANPYPFIKAAAVLVLSSEYEGLGMVLLEAMALGTPVVSVDCPSGPREILQDGRNGILTPAGDSEAMAVAIATMVLDEEVRRVCVNHGSERVKDFDPRRIVQEFESLFLRLARQ